MEGNSRHHCRPTARRGLAAAIAALGLVLASGCQTLDPYTGEQKTSNATKGAAIGAAAGAASAAIVSGKRKNVLIAAGVGALVGAGVGNYMDRKEAALREQLQATGVSVTRHEDVIVLNMPGNVTFATGSSDVTAQFYPVLDSVAIVLNEFDRTYVDVVGHTDSTGRAEFNQTLSERRAGSVAAYLESREVMEERLLVSGLGQNQPVADNTTPDGRALNRRVEIVLTPLT
jgi:outer membrane protein OmpA-like peptidoglycan-associated protein